MKKYPKILFIGGTPRGKKALEYLLDSGEHVVSAVIMKEDPHEEVKVSGDIVNLSRQKKLPSRVGRRISEEDARDILNEYKPDVIFVIGWRTLLPDILWQGVPLGALAAHDSLLPKYRGFAPLNWSIINGEDKTGVTLFRIDEKGVDAGDYCGQKVVRIGPDDRAADVYPRTIEATLELVVEYLRGLRSQSLKWTKQDETEATYTRKRTPEDGKIDWNKSSNAIYDLIRALSPPYPGAFTYLNGQKVIITSAVKSPTNRKCIRRINGKVTSINPEGVIVLCDEGELLLKKIKVKNEPEQDARKRINSVGITLS